MSLRTSGSGGPRSTIGLVLRAAPGPPGGDQMGESKTANVRAHCALWLSGQCHAGKLCVCLPEAPATPAPAGEKKTSP